jgi:SAM-dependent methyltransferase
MAPSNTDLHKQIYESTPLGDRFLANERKVKLPKLELDYVGQYFTNKNGAILDGGCGSGREAFALEDAGFTNIVAFDFSERLIKDAQVTASLRKSRVVFRLADAASLGEFPAASFDYVYYSANFISCIPMPERVAALIEVRRLLRKDGIVILSALNREVNLRRKILLKLLACKNLFIESNFSPIDSPYFYLGKKLNWGAFGRGAPMVTWYTLPEITRLVEVCGFSVLTSSDTVQLQGGEKGTTIYLACSKRDN